MAAPLLTVGLTKPLFCALNEVELTRQGKNPSRGEWSRKAVVRTATLLVTSRQGRRCQCSRTEDWIGRFANQRSEPLNDREREGNGEEAVMASIMARAAERFGEASVSTEGWTLLRVGD